MGRMGRVVRRAEVVNEEAEDSRAMFELEARKAVCLVAEFCT
jgi:hypothetical protein